MNTKELLLYPPSMEEYWKVGDPNHEKPPILEIEPSPYNPMWILVNYLASNPKENLVSIRNVIPNGNNGFDRKHVTVWVLPKGLGVIDNVWGDEEFISIMNGSSFLPPAQIMERVIDIAGRALHNGNGKYTVP